MCETSVKVNMADNAKDLCRSETHYNTSMKEKLLFSESYGSNSETFSYVAEAGTLNLVNDAQEKYKCKQNPVHDSLSSFFTSVFLPQGYPDSVSEDYLQYQIWDTMQAFCSSITGTLATQAMLKGYGVGDEKATAAAATITWMLKDGTGMIGRILFAWLKGTQLDCDAKRWRLHADILNDVAIMLDLIAPLFKSSFIYIVCISSIARSIVGVAGGATRAALTLHQAKRDNMADVSAKDGSQETLVNLMALIAGFIITPLVADNPMLVWILFFIFTCLHLFANYQAVSSVVMETINLPRLYILMKYFFANDEVLKTTDVAQKDPVLRGPGYTSKIKVGVSLHNLIKSFQYVKGFLSKDNLNYAISYDHSSNCINVALKKGASNNDIRKSCFHALLIDMAANDKKVLDQTFMSELKIPDFQGADDSVDLVNSTKRLLEKVFPKFEQGLSSNGWDLTRCHFAVEEWRYEEWRYEAKQKSH